MKKILLSLIILFAFTSLFGQKIITDSEFRISKILDVLSINEDEYYIASISEYSNRGKVEHFIDNTVVEKYYLDHSHFDVDLMNTENGVLVGLFGINECDLFLSNYHEILLDTLSSNLLSIPYQAFEFDVKRIKRVSDDLFGLIEGYPGYFESSTTGVAILNNLDTIFQLSVPGSQLNEVENLGNHIIFYGDDKLIAYDQNNTSLDTIISLSSNTFTSITYSEENKLFYLLTQESIIETDFKQTYKTMELLAGAYYFTDIIYTEKLYLLGHSEEENNLLFIYENEDLQILESSSMNNRVKMEQLYEMANSQVGIAGQIIFDQNQIYDPKINGSYVFAASTLGQSMGPDYSVELLNVEGNGQNAIDFQISLKNNTDDTLTNISVFSTSIDGIWCINKYVDDTIEFLLPQEEFILNTSVSFLIRTSFDGEVCVHAANSENILDTNLADNFSCMQLTSINEEILRNSELLISPNPVTDYLFIDDAESNDQFTIYDLSGLLITSDKYVNGIDVSGIPSGIYFIGNKGGKMSKFVKM